MGLSKGDNLAVIVNKGFRKVSRIFWEILPTLWGLASSFTERLAKESLT